MLGMLSVPIFASADVGLLGKALNKSSNLIETVTDGVTDTVSEVPVTDKVAGTEELIQPVRKVVNTVEDTTDKLVDTMKTEKPIVNVNVSSNPSFGVDIGVVEGEVSKTPSVKVETSIVKAEVDNSVKLEVDVLKVNTQETKDKLPQIVVRTPIVNVETTKTKQSTPNTNPDPKTDTEPSSASVKQTPVESESAAQTKETDIPEIEQPIQHDQSLLVDEPKSGFESLENHQRSSKIEAQTKLTDSALKGDIEMKEEKQSESLSKIPTNEYDQLKVVPTFQSGPSTPTKTAGSGGSLPLAAMNEMEMAIENRGGIFPTMTRLLYDQWLNAPPSQPPRQSLFSISSI